MTRWRALGDAAERLLGGPSGFAAFNGLALVLLALSATAANLFISVATADLVLLSLAQARADRCAAQAKLDELIAAIRGARNALLHAEELDEAAIAEARL